MIEVEQPVAAPAAADPSFWVKYRTTIIIAAVLLTILVVVLLRKKKKAIEAPGTPAEDKKVQQEASASDKFKLAMRKLWGENAHWWKEYINSVVGTTEDAAAQKNLSAISARLVKNHEDIAGLVGRKAGQEKAKQVSEAFKNYAITGGEVFGVLSDKEKGPEADKKWKKAAEELGESFNKALPGLRGDLLKENLRRQTEAMLNLVRGKMNPDPAAGIAAFDGLYNQSMGLADLLGNGQ